MLCTAHQIFVVRHSRMRKAGRVARIPYGRDALWVLEHVEHRGVDGRIILNWIFKKKDGGTDWVDLAKERGRWRVVVNVVMNLRVP